MAERIYTRGEQGRLEPLEEEPFTTEDELQSLIAEHPELLDGEQIRPGDPRRWLLITREKGISETSDSGARWAVDHLIVDQDAVPTLAEGEARIEPRDPAHHSWAGAGVCGARCASLDRGRATTYFRGVGQRSWP